MKTAKRGAGDVAIRVRGLTNRFGSNTVHDELDLDVMRGEILGVIGGSGTGKSVLLRSIVGLNKPVEGEIEVFGQRMNSLSREERVRDRAPLGRDVPGRRAVLDADRPRERQGADARAHADPAPADARARRSEAPPGRPRARSGAQAAVRAFRRHAQARGARARAGARSGASLPRRADGRPRSDRRAEVRRAGSVAQPRAGANRVPRHARSRHAARHLRPRRGAERRQGACNRTTERRFARTRTRGFRNTFRAHAAGRR